jgi:hypothetical protein
MSKAAEQSEPKMLRAVFCPHCGAAGRFKEGQGHLAYIFKTQGCERCKHDGPQVKVRGRGPMERGDG